MFWAPSISFQYSYSLDDKYGIIWIILTQKIGEVLNNVSSESDTEQLALTLKDNVLLIIHHAVLSKVVFYSLVLLTCNIMNMRENMILHIYPLFLMTTMQLIHDNMQYSMS